MKKVLITFLLGVGAGWGGYWFADQHQAETWQAKQAVLTQVEAAAHTIEAKFSEITAQAVREQLARSGVYIVDKVKAAGAVVVDAASDARITATIKTRFLSEPGISAMAINVDSSGGVVTLSGSARSDEELARAIQIAAGTDKVRRVVSTVQVKREKDKEIAREIAREK